MVKINGNEVDVSGKTIAQYLSQTNYSTSRVAVERNGEIVPRSQYDTVTLEDSDIVEIVSFVGGG